LNTFYSIAAKHKVACYFNLRPPGGVSDWAKVMTDWRRWLEFTGPVMTRLVVDNTWDDVKPNGNLDVHDEYPDSQPRKGGHAVALIGYTQDRFIVRSSRGTKWRHNGYGYASLAYAQTAFTEAYGISL
jgi:C1A family cysteine protease